MVAGDVCGIMHQHMPIGSRREVIASQADPGTIADIMLVYHHHINAILVGDLVASGMGARAIAIVPEGHIDLYLVLGGAGQIGADPSGPVVNRGAIRQRVAQIIPKTTVVHIPPKWAIGGAKAGIAGNREVAVVIIVQRVFTIIGGRSLLALRPGQP